MDCQSMDDTQWMMSLTYGPILIVLTIESFIYG